MLKIYSFAPFGYEGSLVQVETDLRSGIPAVDIVGIADGSVSEARERMRSAIRNSGFEFPMERVLISLSPADLRKEGAITDLAMSLSVLSYGKKYIDESVLVLGELELSGKVRPVRAVTASLLNAVESGITLAIVPFDNLAEAEKIQGIKIAAVANLAEAVDAVQNEKLFVSCRNSEAEEADIVDGVKFPKKSSSGIEQVKGIGGAVKAVVTAVSGGHHILIAGKNGSGKTLLLSHIPTITPLLSLEERQSVNRIYSIAGIMSESGDIKEAPFRIPHQSATIEGMCGGGIQCKPGEISLAHNGTLFLDEAEEFRTSVLQMLRVPLESGSVTLSRAGRTTVYPARFQLAIATQTCPCGNYGYSDKICLCSSSSVESYWRKFSSPLLDRIGIRIILNTEREKIENTFTTENARKIVARAYKAQMKRQGKKNQYLNDTEISRFCGLSEKSTEMLSSLSDEISERESKNILRVARTLADMDGNEIISDENFSEAVCMEQKLE